MTSQSSRRTRRCSTWRRRRAGSGKTINNGTTWKTLFQDEDVVSIGDVAIPADDANLVWVGSGENNNRQSSSWGDGVCKVDRRRPYVEAMGLGDTRHVSRIVIDPVNHDVVYVAAQGHLWGPNRERGIYKTTDGGGDVDERALCQTGTRCNRTGDGYREQQGALRRDLSAPAGSIGLNGGGPGSCDIQVQRWRARRGRRVTKGIPEGPLGRIGLDIYRKNPNVVYTRIERGKHGVPLRRCRRELEEDERHESAANVLGKIRIDPQDDHRIYVQGVEFHISDDGGKTFIGNTVPHSDHHALWIDPSNTNHVMTGSDGGVNVSWDRGATWDFLDNLVLGQFYHVGYSMDVPSPCTADSRTTRRGERPMRSAVDLVLATSTGLTSGQTTAS